MAYDEPGVISRCQQGDQEALRAIFEQYQKKVYRIAYGVVREREDARDIVQEVFIKLFRSIKNFRGKSQFYTYLYRMTMNTALDHVRKMKKTRASSLDEEGSPQPTDEIEDRPDRIFYKKELEGKLKEALEKLPADQKATLIFREIEELSYQEIAGTMGCSIGTVMSRLHYGRRRLQELLRDVLKKGDEA